MDNQACEIHKEVEMDKIQGERASENAVDEEKAKTSNADSPSVEPTQFPLRNENIGGK
eukprot:gene9723-10714_t